MPFPYSIPVLASIAAFVARDGSSPCVRGVLRGYLWRAAPRFQGMQQRVLHRRNQQQRT
jgi:hypothetical protein